MIRQSETAPAQDAPREWIFTFGFGQQHAGGYVSIYGTFADARTEMVRRYGQRWSMQYESEEHAGVARWGLFRVRGG